MQGTHHPELADEQAYIEAAYTRLEQIRDDAAARAARDAGTKVTSFQMVYERDVAVRTALERARSLQIGDEGLCFGRTDHDDGARFYIGRRAVFDERHEPLVIDWRVPSAEPFFRATALHPLGLTLRRHLLCEGRTLLAIEDEVLGEGALGGLVQADGPPQGGGALAAAMERPRTGHMRDIVATVQAEQDEVIRDDLQGILAVQGGPGTGKTAVALHRAAFLLFTHRRTLERQGMLVVGPNRRFLRYIDQVLPALGEGGVRLATLQDLAPTVAIRGTDPWELAHLKGDVRMVRVIERAVRTRPDTLDADVVITLDATPVPLRAREVNDLVAAGKRNRRPYNVRRSMLRSIIVSRLYQRYEDAVKAKHGELADIVLIGRREASHMLRAHPEVNRVLDHVWPGFSPQGFIGELLSSHARLAAAAHGILKEREIDALLRERATAWTAADIPLMDEVAPLLGEMTQRRSARDEGEDDDDLTTYGHIVVDEAQDLSPMALRMIARRTRSASVTLVGDLAQAASPAAPTSWEPIMEHLPQRDGTRIRELTVNYRTPAPAMNVAARVLAEASPGIAPPRSARTDGSPVSFVRGDPAETVGRLTKEHRAHGVGTLVVIAARSHLDDLVTAAGEIDDDVVTVLTVEDAKGLEFDHVVVVEPARLVAEATHGLRALYIAITRATQTVVVAHELDLPAVLQDTGASAVGGA